MIERIDLINDIITHESSKLNFPDIYNYLKEADAKRGNEAIELFLSKQNTFSQEALNIASKFINNSVRKTISQCVNEGIESNDFSEGLIAWCVQEFREATKNIQNYEFSVSHLTLSGENMRNYKWEEENKYKNILRLFSPQGESFFGINPVQYDEIHDRGCYLFSENPLPNILASHVCDFKNAPTLLPSLIRGKVLCTLGAGACEDEKYFIERGNAKGVIAIEDSERMRAIGREKLGKYFEPDFDKFIKRTKESGGEGVFHIDQENTEIVATLENMVKKNRKVDVFYSHSSLHYFDTTTLQRILSLIEKSLNPNGYFVLGIKSQKTTLNRDDSGIPLINIQAAYKQIVDDEGIGQEKEIVSDNVKIHSAKFNYDGQIRHFRNSESMKKLLDSSGLKYVDFSHRAIENYETEGNSEEFSYYIYKKEN